MERTFDQRFALWKQTFPTGTKEEFIAAMEKARIRNSALAHQSVVVDYDGLVSLQPETTEERRQFLDQHRDTAFGIIRGN